MNEDKVKVIVDCPTLSIIHEEFPWLGYFLSAVRKAQKPPHLNFANLKPNQQCDAILRNSIRGIFEQFLKQFFNQLGFKMFQLRFK